MAQNVYQIRINEHKGFFKKTELLIKIYKWWNYKGDGPEHHTRGTTHNILLSKRLEICGEKNSKSFPSINVQDMTESSER